MEVIRRGVITGELGAGIAIYLSGDEIASAIDAYLVAHNVHVSGRRTVRVNGGVCVDGYVHVDPSGSVVVDGEEISMSSKRVTIKPNDVIRELVKDAATTTRMPVEDLERALDIFLDNLRRTVAPEAS